MTNLLKTWIEIETVRSNNKIRMKRRINTWIINKPHRKLVRKQFAFLYFLARSRCKTRLQNIERLDFRLCRVTAEQTGSKTSVKRDRQATGMQNNKVESMSQASAQRANVKLNIHSNWRLITNYTRYSHNRFGRKNSILKCTIATKPFVATAKSPASKKFLF